MTDKIIRKVNNGYMVFDGQGRGDMVLLDCFVFESFDSMAKYLKKEFETDATKNKKQPDGGRKP